MRWAGRWAHRACADSSLSAAYTWVNTMFSLIRAWMRHSIPEHHVPTRSAFLLPVELLALLSVAVLVFEMPPMLLETFFALMSDFFPLPLPLPVLLEAPAPLPFLLFLRNMASSSLHIEKSSKSIAWRKPLLSAGRGPLVDGSAFFRR